MLLLLHVLVQVCVLELCVRALSVLVQRSHGFQYCCEAECTSEITSEIAERLLHPVIHQSQDIAGVGVKGESGLCRFSVHCREVESSSSPEMVSEKKLGEKADDRRLVSMQCHCQSG